MAQYNLRPGVPQDSSAALPLSNEESFPATFHLSMRRRRPDRLAEAWRRLVELLLLGQYLAEMIVRRSMARMAAETLPT
jgi:hypothetical protein